jgi:hypothetical protein
MIDWESNSPIFADVSMVRYACQFHEQFSNNFEDEIVDVCINNYIFLADNDQYALNPFSSSYYEHQSEERVVVMDDQDLITRELEGHQYSNKEVIMDETFMDQHASDFSFKDPVAALMESYGSEYVKISDFFYSSSLPGEYCFLKEFLSLLLHFIHHLFISDMDEIFSVLKLLEWLLWKSAFT